MLRIDPECGRDGVLYDYYLYISGETQEGVPLEAITFNDSILYSFDDGVTWPRNITSSDRSWVGELSSGYKVIVYATLSMNGVPSIGCVFPRTELTLA